MGGSAQNLAQTKPSLDLEKARKKLEESKGKLPQMPHYAQIGLWLVLSFLYTDVLPDSSDWAQLGTPAQHSVSPWPVVGDNGELHLCQANLTYTAPAGPASAVVDCVDYTCSATSSLTV